MILKMSLFMLISSTFTFRRTLLKRTLMAKKIFGNVIIGNLKMSIYFNTVHYNAVMIEFTCTQKIFRQNKMELIFYGHRSFLCLTIYMQIHVHIYYMMLFINRCPSIIYHLKEVDLR